MDVIEHISKDQKLVKEFYRVLKPGGVVIATVPAYRWLWTYWDDMLHHKRRYTRKSFSKLLTSAGFDIKKATYFYSYLLPIAIFFRVLKSIKGKQRAKSDFIAVPDFLNTLLLFFAEVESELIKKVSLPTGLSIVCLAEKKD